MILSPPATDQLVIDFESAADALIERTEVCCPRCRSTGATQSPVFVGRDGALMRSDFLCTNCGLEHPIWVD